MFTQKYYIYFLMEPQSSQTETVQKLSTSSSLHILSPAIKCMYVHHVKKYYLQLFKESPKNMCDSSSFALDTSFALEKHVQNSAFNFTTGNIDLCSQYAWTCTNLQSMVLLVGKIVASLCLGIMHDCTTV